MSSNINVKDRHHHDWDGNPDTLPPLEDLCFDPDLCDDIFASKLEAFQMGLTLSEGREGASDRDPSAGRS